MKDETLWQLFHETGDPVGYLMYKAALRKHAGRARALPPREAGCGEGAHTGFEQARGSFLRSE